MFQVESLSKDDWVNFYIKEVWIGTYLYDLEIKDIFPESETKYLPFIKSFNFGNSTKGIIVFFLSINEIQDLISYYSYKSNSLVSLISEENLVVISTGSNSSSTFHLNYEDGLERQMEPFNSQYISLYKLNSVPLLLLICQEKSDINKQALYISRLTLLIIASLSAMGIIIGGYISIVSSKPLFAVLQELQQQNLEDFPDISRGIELKKIFKDLTGQNQILKQEIENNKSFMIQMFIGSLLSGEKTAKELKENANELNLDLNEDFFSIACVELIHHNERDKMLTQLVIKEYVKSHFPKLILFYQLNHFQYAFIARISFSYIEGAKEESETIFRYVKKKIEQDLGIALRMGIGNPRSELSKLYESLSEGRIAIRYYQVDSDRIVLFSQLNKGNIIHYNYSLEAETRLQNFVKLGKPDDLNSLLDELKTKNIISTNQSGAEQQLFINDLKATLIRIYSESAIDDIDMEQRIRIILNGDNLHIDEQFDIIRDLFHEVSGKVQSAEDQERTQRKNEIKVFLNEKFSDPGLCLNSAADHFNLSPFYFSRQFSQHFAISFRQYLENLRLDYVRKKLSDTEEPLKEIASAAGYSSLNTFSKVFKRKYGLSATEYRKIRH